MNGPSDLTELREIERDHTSRFSDERRILSFDDYFRLVSREPARQLRTASQYLRDCIGFFGTSTRTSPAGDRTRYGIFDGAFDDEREQVVGHEEAQGALMRLLNNFIREGRVTRLILFHGPNGSAKSSFINCLAHGLEHYSTTDEGAIYRFNWVFPKKRLGRKKLGFGASEPLEALSSYAHLDDDEVDARLPADLRDHPLLLLPQKARRRLLARLADEGQLPAGEPVGEYLEAGDLSPRSRSIFDALLNAYAGDMQRVLQHIQIERFSFSRRYRRGVVTIEPQLHVDAGIRQVTADQNMQSLPPSLRNLSLYEPFGDLVDANRGFINFNDLLKKPLDAFKYLLATSEKGTVALPGAILHLDQILLASSNDIHLNAFKEYSDFASFKGRIDLVKMPYLRDYTAEQRIYDEQIDQSAMSAQTVPHATWVLAQWAVLTRLIRSNPEIYPTSIREVVGRLTPMDKAELYALGRGPADLEPDETRELVAVIKDLMGEGQQGASYEGSVGASPRELKQLLLNALQSEGYWGLSPLAVFAELREHIKNKSMYAYLQQEVDRGYHDHGSFIDQVQDRWLDRLDGELRDAMGLVNERQYDDLFARYILHVSYKLKGEQVYNETTGRNEDPDAKLMHRLESVWEPAGDILRFREDLVARVGAWHVEFQGIKADYRRMFPKLFAGLESEYHGRQKSKVRRMCEQIVLIMSAAAQGEDPARRGLQADEIKDASAVVEALCGERFGYPRPALMEALTALMKSRY